MEEIKCVGGRIFFVDETSDEVVEFYDQNGVVIEHVGVGSTPWGYRVVKEGSKPRYWVFSHRISSWLEWWPSGIRCIELGTSVEFGSGMQNSNAAIDKLENVPGRNRTIWGALALARRNAMDGCDDWFIPSKGELDVLREFFMANADSLCLINPFDITWLWSSSEDSAQYAWFWGDYIQAWDSYSKDYNFSFVAVRAF